MIKRSGELVRTRDFLHKELIQQLVLHSSLHGYFFRELHLDGSGNKQLNNVYNGLTERLRENWLYKELDV